MKDTKASFMPAGTPIDDTPLKFGKYQGSTPNDIAKSDPGYIVWMHANVLDKPTCSRDLARECEDGGYDDPDELDDWARNEFSW
jgi:hypothetical protein